jgi:hypothetical protein
VVNELKKGYSIIRLAVADGLRELLRSCSDACLFEDLDLGGDAGGAISVKHRFRHLH